jgi:hypothetical protein
LNFVVKGTVDDPQPALDTAALEQQTLNALKGNVGKDLQKDLQNVFKGLFKK